MPEFEHVYVDPEIYTFFDEVVRSAFEELERDHLAFPVKAQLEVKINSGHALITITHDSASERERFLYALYMERGELVAVSIPDLLLSDVNTINYHDATKTSIVDDFMLRYRSYQTGLTDEPPAD